MSHRLLDEKNDEQVEHFFANLCAEGALQLILHM